MYIEGTGFYTFIECHKTESLRNHTATAHKERERLGDRRNAGECSYRVRVSCDRDNPVST
jgi:hypothetical protein